jgi:hypothetical protein
MQRINLAVEGHVQPLLVSRKAESTASAWNCGGRQSDGADRN